MTGGRARRPVDLSRLYPAPMRERWGEELAEELAREVRASGWRAWPGLLAAIADLWLHPAVWPAEHRAERRDRAAVLAVAVALATGFVGTLAAEQGARQTAAPGGAWAAPLDQVLLLAGLALVTPLPRRDLAALRALLATAAHRLTAPALAGAGLVALVHSAAGSALAATDYRFAAVACWWTVLAVGGWQTCRTVASPAGRLALATPHPTRLRLGLGALTAAGVLAGAALLVTWTAGHATVAAVGGILLVLLTWPLAATLRDLRQSGN
ncbi:hypothetical protein [Kitasatospora cathayae]|uniref:Integral membrane protein n=1 Tax=Kitasatospora cathayae TaxID=3004092 RepID=A0ABY7PYQ5_9ACTN|nr:hypothetical protein [Kitasatospora sp. HUAS 3-15]WBP85504.1 hypothetical protein O1G21_06305 [Kitasatospora sp. HUAS 3-15]